jgi:hypothetical protein
MYSLPELQLLRAGLDAITIKGADAQFLSQLQIKIEQQLHQSNQPPKSDKVSEKNK